MILPLVFILFLQKLYGQFFLPQSCVIVNDKEKVVGLYESDGSPITVTHVIKLWKKLCQSVVVENVFFFFSIVFNASTVFSFLKLFNTSDSLLLSQFFLSSQYLLNPTSSSCQFSCHCPSKSKRGYLTLQKCSLS